MSARFLAALATATALSVSTAQAQVVLDVEQPAATGNFSSTHAGWTSQGFRPVADNLAGVGVLLHNFVSTVPVGTVFFGVYAGDPAAGALQIAAGSASVSIAQGSRAWVDVFWTAVAVTPGSFLTLALSTRDMGGSYGIYETLFAGNPYLYGQAGYNYNPGDPRAPYTCCGSAYDLAFRTWTDITPDEVVTPEPISLTLLGTGLAGVAAARRRRRRTATE